MITVEQLDIDEFDLVVDLVTRLLDELTEEEGEHSTPDIESIKRGWKMNQDRFTAFVAVDVDGTRLGIITMIESFAIYANGVCGVISELYVLPEHRNKQIGRVLIETAKEYGRQCGWRRIDVTAPLGEKWDRTVAFYLREDFVHTGPKLRFKF